MKNGPGQARGQRSPVLLAPESGQERNTLFHVMTGLLGPGPRGMAVCHAVARPTHDYKNPLPLSQVRAGGLVSPVSGEGGTFGRRAGAPPPPRPHPPPNALFSGRWAGAVARQATRVSRVPRCGGRVGAAGKKMRARPGGFPCRGQKTWGEGVKERPTVIRRHAVFSGMRSRRRAGGETVRLLVCSLRRGRGVRGRDVSPPGPSRYDGGRHGQAAVAPSPSCQNGMSSRSIPGRWPCP